MTGSADPRQSRTGSVVVDLEVPPLYLRQMNVQGFRQWADRDDFVILDVETTGMGRVDQVIEVCVLGSQGETLLDTLVQFDGENKAFHINGIEEEELLRAPPWTEISSVLSTIFSGVHVLTYNVDFDRRMIAQTCHRLEVPDVTKRPVSWFCLMRAYRSLYRLRRQVSLDTACSRENIFLDPGLPHERHRAWGDTWLAWSLLQTIIRVDAQV